jgi:hypothetical protein
VECQEIVGSKKQDHSQGQRRSVVTTRGSYSTKTYSRASTSRIFLLKIYSLLLKLNIVEKNRKAWRNGSRAKILQNEQGRGRSKETSRPLSASLQVCVWKHTGDPFCVVVDLGTEFRDRRLPRTSRAHTHTHTHKRRRSDTRKAVEKKVPGRRMMPIRQRARARQPNRRVSSALLFIETKNRVSAPNLHGESTCLLFCLNQTYSIQ